MDRRPKALLIDDSEHVLTYLSVFLDRMNFDIYPIQFGVNALNLIQVFSPDIFFLDVDMPVLSGLDVLRSIRDNEDFAETPVVMMSEKSDDARDCLELGADFFLQMPLKVQELHKAVTLCYQKRRIPRRHLRAPLNQQVTLHHDNGQMICQAISLSEGGIYIRKVTPMPVGTPIEIEMVDGDGETMRLKGEVIYVKGISGRRYAIPPGMAIQFSGISPVQSSMVRNMVTDLLIGDILQEQVEPVLTLQ
ncbi:MAG: hypothetical protein C0615_03435 [Desulfuromonas sp.]|nr:MAG: hypothetical protein C0615_03435 [Desulfuromonas sp.]